MSVPSYDRAAAALRRYARESQALAANRQLASWSSNYYGDLQRSVRSTNLAERVAKAELEAYNDAASLALGNREMTPAEDQEWVDFWCRAGEKRLAQIAAAQTSAARAA